jgi:hypothetical protein
MKGVDMADAQIEDIAGRTAYHHDQKCATTLAAQQTVHLSKECVSWLLWNIHTLQAICNLASPSHPSKFESQKPRKRQPSY